MSTAAALAQPRLAGAAAPSASRVAPRLRGPEKAAILVRFLLSEGAPVPLRSLTDDQQMALTEQMARMRPVDRDTLAAVLDEFAREIDAIGLSFAGGLEGALAELDGHISEESAARLRQAAGLRPRSDPWKAVADAGVETLVPLVLSESTEVAAILISKLPVPKAAEILGRLPGAEARRIAFAVSRTAPVAPETVERIGQALGAQLGNRPLRAFDLDPADRIGALLNSASSATRDDLLASLGEADSGLAEQVRKRIFTFADIPARIAPRDVARIVRAVEQPVVVTALAGAGPREAPAVEFMLANVSQRLAGTIREEMAELGRVRDKDAEAAMSRIVTAIRDLEASGEISFILPEESED